MHSQRKDKMIKYCKLLTGNDKILQIKLFSGSISHGVSNEPDAYLEPSQTTARECFCKNS